MSHLLIAIGIFLATHIVLAENPARGILVRIERDGKGKLVGDVDYASCYPKASAITPVPGGVGPMTIALLLNNTLIAACRQRGVKLPE